MLGFFLFNKQKLNSIHIGCLFVIFRALDKNEYNHITATYFLLAERRLKIARQENAQTDRSNTSTPKNGKTSPKKGLSDVVDGVIEILSNNLLAPPSTGYHNNTRTGPDGAVTTVSMALRSYSVGISFDFHMILI